MTERHGTSAWSRRRATLLAAAPLSPSSTSWTWLIQCVSRSPGRRRGAARPHRCARPVWAQVLAMLAALLLALTWIFPSGSELLGLIPHRRPRSTTSASCSPQAGDDIRTYGVPVPDRDGLLFITVLGIGAVAILVDLSRSACAGPALAGLPMLAIYSVPVAVYPTASPVLPFVVGADRLPVAAGHRQRRPGPPVRPPVHRRRPRRRRVGAVAAGRGRPPARPWSAWSSRCCCRWPCPA